MMLASLLFGLALSTPAAPAPVSLSAFEVENKAIVLCAQLGADGKVVDTRVMQSSGSPELDQSARSTVMGSVIMERATAEKLAGLWLPVAIATNGGSAPNNLPSCAAVASLAR